MNNKNKWALWNEFLCGAYESKDIREILDNLPQFLCRILEAEKMLFFSVNTLLEEIEIKRDYGYAPQELLKEKKFLAYGASEAPVLQALMLFKYLPQEEKFSRYALLVRGKKVFPYYFDGEDQEIFASILYQLALLIKNFSLIENRERTFLETIQALSRTIDARCENTKGHTERVTQYSVFLAKALHLPESSIEEVRQAALLHDIGKIAISDRVLKKEGALTEKEWEEMRKHPLYTALILNGVSGLEKIIPMAEYHHERYDGKGYPCGIAGESIPLGARIIAVADAFDAMTSDRIYRKALPVAKAVEIIRGGAGTQFDPQIVDILVKKLENREPLVG